MNAIKQSRYEKLIELTSKALKKSRDSIDKSSAIEVCYGSDAAIFADSKDAGIKVLEQLLDETLEQIDADMFQCISKSMVEHNVKDQLDLLDSVLDDFRREQKEKKELEEFDKASAQDAVKYSKLTNGMTLDQILKYRAHTIRAKYRDELIKQIDIEREMNKDLEDRMVEEKKRVDLVINTLSADGNTLERAADACSFNGVS